MRSKLFESALEEAIRFGSAARLVLTFPGNEDAMHIHPLAYTKIEDSGFRVEIRISDYIDSDMVDDVIFVDSESIESVELQVKQKGKVWQDEPYEDIPGGED
ncbi:MAG: hypothetical protein MI923_04050 [Phycisphaerales bacterium]|nr:hypothetical protein [Phycisphaerales bacterium]